MKHLWINVAIIIFTTNCFSQQDSIKNKTNFIGISTGLGYCRYYDPIESANVYLGKYMPLRITWASASNKYIDRFSFTYASSDLSNTENNRWNKTIFKAKFFQINYHDHRLLFGKNKAKVFIGLGIIGYVSWRSLNYQYTSGNVVDTNNGDLFFSTNISVASSIKQKNNFLLLSVNNSVFAYMNPAIFRTGQIKGSFIPFPRFNAFSFNADYKIKMSRSMFFDLGYSFYYYRYPRYGDISITKGGHNQLFLGFNLKF